MMVIEKFTVEEVLGHKFGHGIFGKPSVYAHIYYLDGLLIDTGYRKMRTSIVEAIGQLPVEQIFISHHHEDHTGNLNFLQQHFNCRAYSSELCAQLMIRPPRISLPQKLSWGDRPGTDQLEIVGPVVETNRFELEVIPVPGHAIDMLALFEAGRGWLFSADLYLHHYIAYFIQDESMAQQIQSIQRVLQLDFDVLFCAHNPQLKNGKSKLRKKLHFLEEFYGKVAQLYHKGLSEQQILRAMSLKEKWFVRLLSGGHLSTVNMIRSVMRDEGEIRASSNF